MKKLSSDTTRDDIDERVVKTALNMLASNVIDLVNTVFDEYAAQVKALTAAGKPPGVDSRMKQTVRFLSSSILCFNDCV